MIDFRLKVFHSVASNLSFTKASNELFISQPAVTKHIKELESEFEVKLFNRIGNKIQLTQAGQVLLIYTKQIFALHHQMQFELGRLKGEHKGLLRLGASTTIAQYVIPALMAKYHQKFREVELSLISGNTEYIEKCLLNNQIDLGIVEGKPVNQDIKYNPFLNDELLVFTSAKNKRLSSEIPLEKFTELPLVLRERGSGTLEIIEKCLQLHAITFQQLKIVMHLGSTEAIKLFIKTGDGVGIASKFAIGDELQANIFKQIKINGLEFKRQFYFISPQGSVPVGLVKQFITFLLRQYNL